MLVGFASFVYWGVLSGGAVRSRLATSRRERPPGACVIRARAAGCQPPVSSRVEWNMLQSLLVACLALCSFVAYSQDEPSPTGRQTRRSIRSKLDIANLVPPTSPIPFVDAHVHLNDPHLQLELMRKWGTTHAVVFWGGLSSNETVAAAARAHPGTLIPFASISPERTTYRSAWTDDRESLLQHLDQLLATGEYRGIGEISAAHFPSNGFPETDFSPLDPMVTGIFALARKYRVPVMLHVEITRIAEFVQLLKQFPDVPVIWAHGGYTPLFLARRLLEQHSNLYYELSARTWPRHPRSPDYTILHDGKSVWPGWLELIESMSDRFLVGTDSSNRSASADAMKLSSVQSFLGQLSPRARENVARRTLFTLIGMDIPEAASDATAK